MLEKKLASTFTRLTLLLVAILVGITVVQLIRGDDEPTARGGSLGIGIVDAQELRSVLGVDDLREAPSSLGVQLQQLAREKGLELITAEPIYIGSRVELLDVTSDVVERLRGSDD